MKTLPVLSIGQFPVGDENTFYANDFIEHVNTHHKNINKPHKHDFYLTVLFTSGSGIHEVDFESYEIKRGTVFTLTPGQCHNWNFSNNTQGYIFFHSRSFYEIHYVSKRLEDYPFFYSQQNSPCLTIEEEKLASFEQLCKIVLKEYRTNNVFKLNKIINLIDLLYIELSREYLIRNTQTMKLSPYQDKLRKLEELIDENYLNYKAAGDYAEMMNMSNRHLNRIVQSELGKTTTDLISEKIILEAKRIMAFSPVTVSEVADKLGYSDHSYFSRLFKKKTGISPTDFSKKYQKL